MFLRSILAGVLVTSLLVSLLALSHLLGMPQVEVMKLTEVEIVELKPPPPPPDLSEPEEPDDLPPPPAPRIELTLEIEQPDAPRVALSLQKIDLTTPVEAFHTDSAPAKLPVVRKPTPRKAPAKPTYTRKPSPKPSPAKPKVTRPTPKKAYYSNSELDGLPRAIRTGSFRWPSRARGTSGTVRLLLEINENGRVRVVSVASSTDPHLSTAASRVARSSRYTAPRKNGQKVKARFYRTYVLKKP